MELFSIFSSILVAMEWLIEREDWKRLQFEDLKPDEIYEISNYGRLRHWSEKANEFVQMKLSTVRDYKYFMWFRSKQGWENKIKKIIHRLVAAEFCAKPKDGEVFVIHLDYDKGNNYYKNLKWVSRTEMNAHSKLSPNVMAAQKNRKGRITNAKLSAENVLEIKKMVKKGEQKLYKIAQQFGITHTQLNRIRSGQNWAHIQLPDEV